MNKRQRKKREKRLVAQHMALVTDFTVSQFARSSFVPQVLVPVALCSIGRWMDARGIVHVVNSRTLSGFIDLGRETECAWWSWDPDNPEVYPVLTDRAIDCMTCLVRLARPCLP